MLQLTTIVFLIAFSTLAVLHAIATKLFLYWHFLWLDIPMHLFGGAVVALGLFTLRDLGLFPNAYLRPIPVLFLVLLVSLLWEGFELSIGIPLLSDFVSDTVTDLCMGLLGAYSGYRIGNSLRNLA